MTRRSSSPSASSDRPRGKKSARALRFDGALVRSTNKLWGCHVEVPARVAGELLAAGSRRVVRTLNGELSRQCALIPHGNGRYVITVNKSEQRRLGLEIGATVRVGLTNDGTTYGLPLPEEMRELLRQDKEGDRVFHALTPGKRRTLLYLVDHVKDPDKRAARAIVVVRHLKETQGKIDFRQLTRMLRGLRS